MGEREERELERRGMLPPESWRYEFQASAARVARDACHLEGVGRARSLREEQRYRWLSLMAKREDPLDDWLDE
jgi:hypothetical protein